MRTLGIDPAIRNTGYAVLEGDHQNAKALDYGVISIPAKIPQSGALEAICSGIKNLIKKWEPDEVAVEGIIYVQSHRTAISMGAARAAALIAAADCGLPNGTVATSSRRGKKIATSISHDAEELDAAALASIQTSLDVFLALMEPVEPTKEPYEVLYYLSNGLTPKDISELYKMPLRRVVDLRNAAVKSLKANNVEHAVAIGLKVGIL